jgi:flagellar motor switch protein FliG
MSIVADRPSNERLHKSAVLLASLGTDLAARVLSHMEDQHVEALIGEMTRLGHIRTVERYQVLEEFGSRIDEDPEGVTAGPEYARLLLEQAIGPERAGQFLNGRSTAEPASPSLATILETTSPESLAALVADEHPQLIALLIGQLTVDRAAELLAALPADAQGPVAARLAEMEAPGPIALEHLERCLVEKLQGDLDPATDPTTNGPRRVADILGRMRRSLESLVLASLEQHSPALAQKVSRYRFTFEDMLQLDARSLQRILRDVDSDTLRLAMKGLDKEQQQIIFGNMSERAAARLLEELESGAPAQLRDVEAAQQTMGRIARTLQETGEVQFAVGDSEGDSEETDV